MEVRVVFPFGLKELLHNLLVHLIEIPVQNLRIVVNQAIDKSLHILLMLGPYHKVIIVQTWHIWLIKMAPGDFG